MRLLTFIWLSHSKVISLALAEEKINIHTDIWFLIGPLAFNTLLVYFGNMYYCLSHIEQRNLNMGFTSGVKVQEENGIGSFSREH